MLDSELVAEPIVPQPLINSNAAVNRTVAAKERDGVAGIDLSWKRNKLNRNQTKSE